MTISTLAPKAPEPRPPSDPEPDECPDVYASVARGDCLEPVYKDGDCLVFSKSEKPVPGDFIGLWLRPGADALATPVRRVKRLVLALPPMPIPCRLDPASEAEPLVVVEQLNPPRTYCIGISHVLAVHKVIGTARSNGDGTARFAAGENPPAQTTGDGQ